MIIFIGGVSCTGKTKMAQTLLEKYKIPYLSIDHLKMALVKGWDACDFTPETNDVLLSRRLWPILRGFLTTAVENGQHMIIEGCYLLPELIAALEPEYAGQIISFYLTFSDRYIREHYDAITAHRCVIEQRGYDTYTSEQLLRDHGACRELWAAGKLFVIDDDYETEMGPVYDWLDGEIARLRQKESL